MKIHNGITRKVFIIGKYAIKVPQTRYKWRHFLQGLLANMQEKTMSSMRDKRLCPVLFSAPGGFLNIMPNCDPLSECEFDVFDPKSRMEDLPVENKICSFGWMLDHESQSAIIVAVDYGN